MINNDRNKSVPQLHTVAYSYIYMGTCGGGQGFHPVFPPGYSPDHLKNNR